MTGKFVRGAAVLAAGAVSIAGCSRSTETTTGADGSSNDKIVKIGLIAPLTGEISSFGLGIKNSVDLAVNEANKAAKIKGYKIVLQAEDDAGKPEQGAAAATKLSSDPQVAGVIGTYNSSVAQQVAPVLQRSRIVQISPANTNPTLTRGTDDANPKRLWDTYFRTCTIDSLQAPFAADYAFNTANLKSVVTVHDKKTYGQGLVAAFETEFQRLGGKVLVQDQVGENDRDFGSLVTKITNAKPVLFSISRN